MPGPGQDLFNMLGALGRMGVFRNPLEEILRREGVETQQYIRYKQMPAEERKRRAARGDEWVLRCQKVDEKAAQRVRETVQRRRAEAAAAVEVLSGELRNFVEERFGNHPTIIDLDITETREADTDIWAEATAPSRGESETEGEIPDEDDVYHGADKDTGKSGNVGKEEKLVEALERLAALKASGAIDAAEYKKAKKKLLK